MVGYDVLFNPVESAMNDNAGARIVYDYVVSDDVTVAICFDAVVVLGEKIFLHCATI